LAAPASGRALTRAFSTFEPSERSATPSIASCAAPGVSLIRRETPVAPAAHGAASPPVQNTLG
jgi:hypothetical protein